MKYYTRHRYIRLYIAGVAEYWIDSTNSIDQLSALSTLSIITIDPITYIDH